MDEPLWPFYLTAVGTGLAFGYTTQRGGFCLTRALSNLFIMRDAAILRAYLVAEVASRGRDDDAIGRGERQDHPRLP